ncbi:hypothetical protein H4684_003711 [Desulfomicrobium macestii]|uniref:Uncharacterized protein n=1 Tax=Desulfomicrobium macestii TaxID=90731 RepID=A0ABR9H8H6_9BACT|nr:hypothetical protein [Desulfomicrobium macestii]MBE1427027.1 hypothetical protein [Desulfomicrobium macestii]
MSIEKGAQTDAELQAEYRRLRREAKTNAERQAEYRRRRREGEVDEKQLSTWISEEAKHNFARIAVYYGITEKELLEKLIVEEHARIFARLSARGKNEHF